jgi:hypothetical protein
MPAPTPKEGGTFVERAASALFSEGWAFILPYCAVYLVGLGLDLKSGTVRSAFLVLHVALLVLLVVFARQALRTRSPSWRELGRDPAFWFWVVLTLGFLLPGAYLEFPSDPWEHLRRLNLPRADVPLRAGEFVEKFAYFWGWSILSLLERTSLRPALDLLSAFWQILLAFQLYRFSRRLGFPEAWSKIQVLGVLATFGNNIFSFFRYYALSSTPLAYIAYLRAAVAVLDLLDGRRRARSAAVLAACLLVMRMNHLQELLLFLAFVGAAILAWVLEHLTPRRRVAALVAILGIGVASLALGRVLMEDPKAYGLYNVDLGRLWPWMSRFGNFRIYDPSLPYWHTIGAHGLCAVVLAVCLWPFNRLVATLVLAPFVLLLFPPFCLLLAHQVHPRNSYRLLFAMPDSFMLVAAFEGVVRGVPRLARLPRSSLCAKLCALGLLTGFGLWANAPGWGKLRFQYYRPSAKLSVEALDTTAEWFSRHPPLDSQCVIKSDPITEFTLAGLMGQRYTVERVSGLHVIFGVLRPWKFEGPEDLNSYRGYQRLCGFLAIDRSALEAMRGHCEGSWAGRVSTHWPADSACFPSRVPPSLPADLESLTRLGWRKTAVPPFYWYYYPPAPP